jgi:Na+-translocating ferredoxin:NAD+ oxidoreductase RnfD subunit
MSGQPAAPSSPPAKRSLSGSVAHFFRPDNRYLPPILITLILLVGNLSYGLLESFSRTALAIAVSMLFEIGLTLLTYRKFPNLASAYITGISVGILIRSPVFWPYALCSALSITSKYVLRWRGRHLWNPSNFGISIMLLLVPEYVAALSIQWGNSVWPMLIVWVLGAAIVYRVKRFHITATYVICFVVLSFIRTFFTGHSFLAEVAPITGPMYQLFIFFMITDPKTTVKPRWAQCLVVALVAVAEMILRLAQNVDAPFYALAIVGPIAMAVEIYLTGKRRPVSNAASVYASSATSPR